MHEVSSIFLSVQEESHTAFVLERDAMPQVCQGVSPRSNFVDVHEGDNGLFEMIST